MKLSKQQRTRLINLISAFLLAILAAGWCLILVDYNLSITIVLVAAGVHELLHVLVGDSVWIVRRPKPTARRDANAAPPR